MKMHVLSGGRLRMRRSVYVPGAERSETIDLPVSCYLLRHAQGNVLFDTGCHPLVHDDAEARWGGMAKVMVPIAASDDYLIAQLASVGLAPSDIDVVVNSHFHSDHCGCNEFFERATIVVHAAELAAARADDAVAKGYLPVDWSHPMPLETIEAERDLYGDGRIVLLPMPGHTVGTTTALVRLPCSGEFLLASDSVALALHLEQELQPKQTWDPEAGARSMAEIRRIQAGGATVLFGHDLEQWTTLRKGADAYF